jgi:hypothetical protein
MTFAAHGTVKAISIAATPPSAQASAMRAACSEPSARTPGTGPESAIFCRTFSFIIDMLAAANVTAA